MCLSFRCLPGSDVINIMRIARGSCLAMWSGDLCSRMQPSVTFVCRHLSAHIQAFRFLTVPLMCKPHTHSRTRRALSRKRLILCGRARRRVRVFSAVHALTLLSLPLRTGASCGAARAQGESVYQAHGALTSEHSFGGETCGLAVWDHVHAENTQAIPSGCIHHGESRCRGERRE